MDVSWDGSLILCNYELTEVIICQYFPVTRKVMAQKSHGQYETGLNVGSHE